MSGGGSERAGADAPYPQTNYSITDPSAQLGYFAGSPVPPPPQPAAAAPVRLMLSCNSCRKKKIRCNGAKPVCESCQRSNLECLYSPVGPRKKPRRTTAKQESSASVNGTTPTESGNKQRLSSTKHRSKRRAASHVSSDDHSEAGSMGAEASSGLGSVSHLMLERVREADALELPQALATIGGGAGSPGAAGQPPMMEMLRLQTQISTLVDQLRNITIRASGITPSGTPMMSPSVSSVEPFERSNEGFPAPQTSGQSQAYQRPQLAPNPATTMSAINTPPASQIGGGSTSGNLSAAKTEPGSSSCSSLHLSTTDHARGLKVSRDLINHLIGVYFQYSHPAETGMHPPELYRERLQRAQVSEPFLLSVLAVASRMSDDPRVKREPAYLSGYDFFERVTRGLMMDVLERDCVENMLTLNNLAVYAVGLPVANRGWYFSGLAMRMATQMSLQKVDAPGRMPGASMMSGPGIESARRAFWTTLLLEALASFASGEPPPITIQDIHVAEPFDDPSMLNDSEPASHNTSDAGHGDDHGASRASTDGPSRPNKTQQPNVSAYVAQLSLLLVRVARLNGNRHPESAQFSPEYAALHAEMVAWYHGLPDNMQIKPSVAKDEICSEPQVFAAKMFVHCHYHAAIIALHQPRVDLVRVESTGGLSSFRNESSRESSHTRTPEADQQWRQLAQQQCLTAACSMTELLALARTLDVRYHIVTFGFAVFMAGVVHVGAVACTPRDSTERQYSVNCVKEHVRCLDRLGKYFAFHFIMAKHIRAQLQTIEATDLRRQSAVAAAVAAAGPQQQQGMGFPQNLMQAAQQLRGSSGSVAQQFAFPSQIGSAGSFSMDPAAAAAAGFSDFNLSSMAFGAAAFLGADAAAGGFGGQQSSGGQGASESWFNSPNVPSNTSFSNAQGMELFSGLFNSPQTTSTPPPPSASSMSMQGSSAEALQAIQVSSSTSSATAQQQQQASAMLFGMQGMAGMSGMSGLANLGSLAELFSPSRDGSSSSTPLYPEKILNSSQLAPQRHQNGSRQHRANTAPEDVAMASAGHPSNSMAQSQADPAAPLRLTSPGGFQQFGSLPPFSPL